jgi:multidrug efflux pump subunit AcrA (membrane-fusion protein)
VSPQLSGGGGIAKIVDMDSLEVDVEVAESDINRVHLKQAATIALKAYPDRRMTGEVTEVSPTADRANNAVKVHVRIKERDPRILPEMGTKVSFLPDGADSNVRAATRAPLVIVPPEAVHMRGRDATVFVITGDRVQQRMVRLGSQSIGGQIIMAGLAPGTILALGNLGQLRDGEKVRVVP